MTAATVYLFFHFKTEPIFNVGDAMAFYLEHPENSTNFALCNQAWAQSWPTKISFLGDVRKPTLSKGYCKRSWTLAIVTAATTTATVPQWREQFSTPKSSEDTM
ncbi:uncharacterized protein EAF02_006919 [Botrytis sinoallii]|uniref:uncharacterized protein n=1 Tax=Botrytis sinoallii TaxID=1463999 RepID=UPI0019002E01|nr:uncharacterized protein EAF02_006919 [Botrytis sinoallii]KAF7881028.1 hypothetical protein EAF02_006919 [Botrytis sinoallii]